MFVVFYNKIKIIIIFVLKYLFIQIMQIIFKTTQSYIQTVTIANLLNFYSQATSI